MSRRERGPSISVYQVPLRAHLIRLREPGPDFVVNFVQAFEAKRVEMIARRKGFDPAEAWTREATRQNNMAVDPVLPNREGGETHTNLESDPGLLGQHDDRAVFLREGEQFVEDRPDVRRFAFEMRRERIGLIARMRLVPVRELPAAFGATPQWWIGRPRARFFALRPHTQHRDQAVERSIHLAAVEARVMAEPASVIHVGGEREEGEVLPVHVVL